MPGMDGLALLKAIRSEFPEVSVYMVTGGSSYSEKEFKVLGAKGYISKPFSEEILIQAATQKEPMEKAPTASTPTRVWILEDEKADQDLLLHAFKSNEDTDKVKLAFFETGNGLIEGLTKNTKLPDLVILDINVPGISGLDTLQKCRDKKLLAPTTNVIFLTSSKNEKDEKSAMELGAKAYHNKPMQKSEWKHLARAIVQSWLSKKEDKGKKAA